ncbi:MAG: hypothetical protein IKL72_02145 [Firmicutes bacterium]|nr:hypothetical protein [Bacillota bacterium]
MNSKSYCLGIDTSNYTTSAALVDEELNIVGNSRKILEVRQGERGLRQSQALFEHIGNLPQIIENMGINEKKCRIAVVAASERPRNVEGSYMPVFLAGSSLGRSVSAVTGAQYYGFSHQEGHIESARYSSGFNGEGEFLCLHLSGGTTEVLKCREHSGGSGYTAEIVGATKDLALGQLIDRVGVSLEMPFPCGKYVDERACRVENDSRPEDLKDHRELFCRIKTEEGMMNVSGIETQIQRYIDKEKDRTELFKNVVSFALLSRIGQALNDVIGQARESTGIKPVIMAGGVSSSRFIRKMFEKDKDVFFGSPELSSDNAAGIAMMGMKRYLADETGSSFTG